ncbi:MAG: hypothetical protein KDJ65_29640 [Anaerolineae bacterium]|nr:hypothetical protein [Anaerolineae bacterium]
MVPIPAIAPGFKQAFTEGVYGQLTGYRKRRRPGGVSKELLGGCDDEVRG